MYLGIKLYTKIK